MLFVIYLIPAFLALALIAWVYFDATELGKPAIPWALAQPVLWWFLFLPLILYAIFREQGQRRAVPPGAARRQAAYVLSFVGYAAVAYGAAALIGMAVVLLSTDIGDTAIREIASSSVAAVVVGSGLWAAAWLPAEGRVASIDDDAEFRATFYLHRAYLYTVFGVAWLVTLTTGMWFLAGLVSSLSGVGDVDVEAWSWTLGPLAVSFMVLASHYAIYFQTDRYRAMLRRFEAIPPPPTLGVSPSAAVAAVSGGTQIATGAAYCGSCGTAIGPDQQFCTNCGSRLMRA